MGNDAVVIIPIFVIAVLGGIVVVIAVVVVVVVVVIVVVAFEMYWNATNALYELFIRGRGVTLVLEEHWFATAVCDSVPAASGVYSLVIVLMVG